MKQQIVTKAVLRDGEQATEYDMPQEDKEKTRMRQYHWMK